MSPYSPIERAVRDLRGLLISFVVVAVLVVGYVLWQSYEGRVDIVNGQRSACERGKLDRMDNAEGWTAHSTYIQSVILAPSVKEDVKTAARVAQGHYDKISASLTDRSHIDCESAYPSASLMP